MLKTIINNEIKSILFSPKFTVIFTITSIMMLMSVYLGIKNYQFSVEQYNTINRLVKQEMSEKTGWMELSTRIHREPDPMQIFISGVTHDIGRYSSINSQQSIKLTHSFYSDSPVFAIFRLVDFSFIVTVILTLFVILFTYDAINGEVERGTLRLVFSNAVPRKIYILGKTIGIWLGLIIPLLIPLLLSFLFIILWNIPFTSEHWFRLLVLILISMCLYSFFIVFGIFISTLSRRSSVSFLLALVVWICLIFIIPRAGIIAAGQIIQVPGVEEMDGKKSSYEKQAWEKYISTSQERWEQRNISKRNLSEDERKKYNDDHMWEWMSEEEEQRKNVQTDIEKYNMLLNEEFRNKRIEQEKLAFLISRFSPVSAYQLSAMILAGTDITTKSDYENELNAYRQSFVTYKEDKQKKTGGMGGIRIMVDSDGTFDLQVARDQTLDLSDMPQFKYPVFQLSKAISSVIIDLAVISLLSVILLVITFYSFMKYDVR